MTKGLLFIAIFCGLQTTTSQEIEEKKGKPFFTSSLNFTFGRNEYDEGFCDDEPFFSPAGVLLRAGFGYQFNRYVALSLNAGLDHHWVQGVTAIPGYGTFRFNFSEKRGNAVFTDLSFGRMWRPSPRFPDGKYYGLGFGYQVSGVKRWSTIVRIDFHRKIIPGLENNRLDSLSLGLGFSFF